MLSPKAKAIGEQPAFPVEKNAYTYNGLTKREMAVFMAMQGLCANGSVQPALSKASDYSIWAIEQAEAILEQLAKE